MLLQDFHCDSASQSGAKAVVVQIFKLPDNYYVRVEGVTGVGAGPLYPDLQPSRERGGGGNRKRRMRGQKLKEYDLNSLVLTSLQ